MLAQSCTRPDGAPCPNLSAERGDLGKDAFYKFPPVVHIPYRNNSTYKSHFPLIPSKKPYKVASDLAFKCEVDLHTLKGFTCFWGGWGQVACWSPAMVSVSPPLQLSSRWMLLTSQDPQPRVGKLEPDTHQEFEFLTKLSMNRKVRLVGPRGFRQKHGSLWFQAIWLRILLQPALLTHVKSYSLTSRS